MRRGAASGGAGNLSQARDAVDVARGARTLIDVQLTDARQVMANAEAAVRQAALRVLASEELENLIEAATAARADYVEAIGGLSFLIRNGAVPSGDARPNQLVRDADTAPIAMARSAVSRWRDDKAARRADGRNA